MIRISWHGHGPVVPVCAALFVAATATLPAAAIDAYAQRAAGTINEFPTTTTASGPIVITAGPDGSLWFTEYLVGKIGRITPTGAMTEFVESQPSSAPYGITGGSDGKIWFTEGADNRVGRCMTNGAGGTSWLVPTIVSGPYDMASGPDGNVWFNESAGNKIVRVTTAGTMTEFPVPSATSNPAGIVSGPGGALWFTEFNTDKVGRITTAGVITEFPVSVGSGPRGIAVGADGNLWFAAYSSNKIGRMTPAGVVTNFAIPTPSTFPWGIAAGSDGALWFTERTGNAIGRITTAGVVTEFPLATPGSLPMGIASGPDGNIWFTEYGTSRIGQLLLCTTPATPTPTNDGPFCLGGTLSLSTPQVVSALYSWTGPNGFTSTSRTPSIANATAAAAGTYTVVVNVNGCASAPGTTVAAVGTDVTPPVVTAPAPIVVDQASCCSAVGGVTPAQSPALLLFVDGGSATDDCAGTISNLGPVTPSGGSVWSGLCFRGGSTTLTFRFQDAAGNVGTATSTVTVRMYGDLNLDGAVDPADMVVLRAYFNFVAWPGTAPFSAPLRMADLNHDTIVDPSDFVILRGYFNFVVACLAP